MQPIKVRTPDVSGTGGRNGWCKVVTGIKHDAEFQGEFTDGDSTLEMLPGDLLLCVKPVGHAKDKTQAALLYKAVDDLRHPGNLEQIFVTTAWPAAKEAVASIAKRMLQVAPRNRYQPVIEAKPGPSATKEFIRRTCSSSIRDALGGGTSPDELLKLLADEVSLATGQDAKQLLLKAAAII